MSLSRPAAATAVGADAAPPVGGRRRTLLLVELTIVLALSLGRSGIYAAVNLLEAATAPGALADQTASLHRSYAPDRPWFDLTYQVLSIVFSLVPIALAGYLLHLSGVHLRAVWAGGAARWRDGAGLDVARGALLAAGVGSVGLAFYLLVHALGFSATVVADGLLGDHWWHLPVLVLSALENALLEEFVVLGYVLVRLRQVGLGEWAALAVAAVLRGSYHLYQGLGGFVGNLVMGLLFGWLYRRWGRILPFVVAHWLLDIGAFVGYALLAGRVDWIPT
ncbi:CPBP family intramembrane glutamic endopeptidase [Nocardioides sp.]|uniref:CPBP family intramembrane glutamic endopeptidase n=1 Tax=Nocardioides sp. TaxID=35761 RepID=UPI0035175AFF